MRFLKLLGQKTLCEENTANLKNRSIIMDLCLSTINTVTRRDKSSSYQNIDLISLFTNQNISLLSYGLVTLTNCCHFIFYTFLVVWPLRGGGRRTFPTLYFIISERGGWIIWLGGSSGHIFCESFLLNEIKFK